MDAAPEPLATDDGTLPEGRWSGRAQFQELVRSALAQAAQQGWREIMLSDADFADWPLGERAVHNSLQAWARTGRRLTLLAHNYDEIVRRHARFVGWRGQWDHIIVCRRVAANGSQNMPSALWSPHWVMQRLDRQRCIGICGTQPEQRLQLQENLRDWLNNRSSPGFAASTLGL